ncbi:MAG TPA: hypothetical protein VNW06_00630 [Cytophagaceae bacterium]|jgi:hypothetical protein|nr:hypothetical protein [Cytophagaceae bacterium]
MMTTPSRHHSTEKTFMQTIADVITQFIRAIEPKALAPYYAIDFIRRKRRRKKKKKHDGLINTSVYFHYEGEMQIIITWNYKYDIYFFQEDKIIKAVKGAKYPELIELLNWVQWG